MQQYNLQSTLPKSNLSGLEKQPRHREKQTHEGSKTIEHKEKRTRKDPRPRRPLDLCEFDSGKVSCIASPQINYNGMQPTILKIGEQLE